ncbi:collagen-binding domain-containing protein [Kurthia massiliensis]|uniref:collagen-binding domain-containing protein n=1 Tax=Kurthia massiliensis TaxID=1033739 RepID=UPI0011CC851C|nr:collagen-binding domain-containing protein [Kurthia massiliensis]
MPTEKTAAPAAVEAEVQTETTKPVEEAVEKTTVAPTETTKTEAPQQVERVQVEAETPKKEATQATNKVQTPVVASGDVKEDIKQKVHTDPDENMLGIAQNFHIFANEANLKTHTDGNVATKILTGGNANFGTNIKSDNDYKNKIGDISYIQSVAPNVKIQSSSGVAERDTLLVVGKDIAVTTTDHDSAYVLDGQKMDHFKQIAQDQDGTTYIDFEKEFSQLCAVSQSLSNGKTEAAVLSRQGFDYTLDLSTYEQQDGKIVLNLDAKDLTDQSGDLIIAGIPEGVPVIVNVKSGTEQQKLDVQKKIVLKYADGSTRTNQETENFTDSTILWNFESFGGLIHLNREWQGTILATDATLSGNSNIDGFIIVDKFLGAGETHRWDFQGKNPISEQPTEEVTPDPELDPEVTPDPETSEQPTEEVPVHPEVDKPVETPQEHQPVVDSSPETPAVETEEAVTTIEKTPATTADNTTVTEKTETVVWTPKTVPATVATPATTSTMTAVENTTPTTETSTNVGLPQTGEHTATTVGIGLGALLAGAAALLFGRRKK